MYTNGTPIHSDSIKRIIYCQSDKATISCCQDHKKSLVIKHIRDEWDPYVFHIQNVQTNDYHKLLLLIFCEYIFKYGC